MGALTLKPSAYTLRPWEVFTRSAPDLFDHGGPLTLGVRGARIVRIGHPGWLRDRVRFGYDGFRRQRLVRPYRRAAPVGWAAAAGGWWSRLGGSATALAAGPAGAGPLALLLVRGGRPGGPSAGCVYDLNRAGRAFVGPFGLAGCAAALAVPVQLGYEESQHVPPPSGVPTLAGWAALCGQAPHPHGGAHGGAPRVGTPPWGGRLARSSLQVSPVQRLLWGAAG